MIKILSGSLCLLLANQAFANSPIKLDVTGLEGKPLENVTNQFAIYDDELPPLPSRQIAKDELHKGVTLIKKAIQPYGYFKPQISPNLSKNEGTWVFHYEVQPGKALRITKYHLIISGRGAESKEIQNIVSALPLKQGDILSMDTYNKTKTDLLLKATNAGYLNAQFKETKIAIDLENYTSIVTLHFDTGKRYFFGKINIKKNPLRDSLIKRFLTFSAGDPYSHQAVIQSQQNLTRSPYFKLITVTAPKKMAKDQMIPVFVDPTMNKRQVYQIGLGWGSFTGPRVTLGVILRRINAYGHNFKFLMNLSTINKGIDAKYIIPGHNPLTDSYYGQLKVGQFEPNEDITSIYRQVSLGSDLQISEFWHMNLKLSYLVDRYQLYTDPYENTLALSPEVTFSRLHLDNNINPTTGSKISLMVRGGSDHLLSTTSFTQGFISIKIIHPLTKDSEIILSGSVGGTKVTELKRFPVYYRFFAGGPGSVRGYSIQSLGPGRFVETVSAQVQHRIFGHLYGGIFIDAGNAADTFKMDLLRGIGVVLVYKTPVGPIQASIAQANSRATKPLHFDVSIGATL